MAIDQWLRAGLEDSPKKNTIAVLDGVRALACLIVIMYHIYQLPRDLHVWADQPFVHPFLNALQYSGKYGVTLFFVLSGFLLFIPFARALLFERTWPSVRRFYLRRACRIMPAYYLTLILIVLLFQSQYLQLQRWPELGLFLSFLMDSTQATFKQLNAPFWTLAIEWQYYMLLPLLVLAMRALVWRVKQDYRLSTTCACVVALIAWGLCTRYFGTYFEEQHPVATLLVSRPVLNVILFCTYGVSGKYLEDFGVGMLLALFFVYAQHPSVSPRLRTTLRGMSPWLCGAGLLGLAALILWNYNERYANALPFVSNPLLNSNYYRLSELCFSLSYGLCILALLFGSSWLRRPFEWLPLRRVGMVSFSLYMWHLPLLIILVRWGQPLLGGWPPLLEYSAYWLWVLMIILPFSCLFFISVERPGVKFAERYILRRAPG